MSGRCLVQDSTFHESFEFRKDSACVAAIWEDRVLFIQKEDPRWWVNDKLSDGCT